MIVTCKTCGLVLSKSIHTFISSEILNPGEDLVAVGYYTQISEEHSIQLDGQIAINLKDKLNMKSHSDLSRLNGCCGLDGFGGLNQVCLNNHEVGTEMSDCWMPHALVFDPEQVTLQVEIDGN